MCNITSHQGNASQNYNEISPHTCQNGYHQEEQTCWQGCGEKGTLAHCWWESTLVQPLRKTVQKFLKKLKIELSYDPTLLLQGVYLKKPKNTNSKRSVHSMSLCTFLVKWISSLLIIPFSNTFRVSLQADSGGTKMALEFLVLKIKIGSLHQLQRTTEEMLRPPIPCRSLSRLETKTGTVFVTFLLWQDARCPQLTFVNHRSWWAMVDPQTLCNSLAPRSRPMASEWSYSALLTLHFDWPLRKVLRGRLPSPVSTSSFLFQSDPS